MLFITTFSYSQISGKVTYEEYKNTGIQINSSGKNLNDDILNKAIKNAETKNYELNFTNNESIYKEFKPLNINLKKVRIINLSEGIGKLYKKDLYYINQVEFFGKYFLIKDNLSLL